jgi:hypothetical protein
MNDRKPICLFISAAMLLLLDGIVLNTILTAHISRGMNEGYPANFGTTLVELAVFALLYLVGFLLALCSLIGGERYRWGAVICALLYITPYIAILVLPHFGFR